MLKKEITFEDYEGGMMTETHYFHLSKSELVEMETGAEGGSLAERMKSIVAEESVAQIIDVFKTIILKAYGRRDGPRFIKSDELSKEFSQTLAYDALFMELVTNDKACAEFIMSLMPKDLAESPMLADVASLAEASKIPDPPAKPWADREPTRQELSMMSKQDLVEVFGRRVLKEKEQQT